MPEVFITFWAFFILYIYNVNINYCNYIILC